MPVPAPRWRRYVAVGDSLTEGLCDTSRMPQGEFRGWADRLAMLLALASPAEHVDYANLAVRSRKVADVVDRQIPIAAALGADLVTVLVGGNDLVGRRADARRLADRLGAGIGALRATGCDVLVVTAFMPRRPAARLFEARFAAFNARLRELANDHGAMLLDVDAHPELVERPRWSEDRVHLNAAGHRGLAYAAARVLEVPDAVALGALELAVHDADESPEQELGDLEWLRRHAVPWALRRLAGRTAGDGRSPKRETLTPVAVQLRPGTGSRRGPVSR